jgi:membrane protein
MAIWVERLEDGLFQKSRSMRPPWGPALRFLRFPAALIRDWLSGEINVRAMSLAYTTLLSLVPLMVFSFSILKGFGARSDLELILDEFFRPMGSVATELTANIMQFVTNMRSGVVGTIGLAFLIYTVISTIQKVEGSFNFVWRVARPRSFTRRFTEYLSVMIVGPILLALALGLMAAAQNSRAAQWLDAYVPLAWTLSILGKFVPYAIVTIVFAFMYWFIPNTRVKLTAALIGGVTAGIIWALVGRVFTTFILYSSQLVAVYTGFAIVLTTLIWVYLSWLILLIGAQLAFYLQYPQYLRHGEDVIELNGRAQEQVALSVMYLIGCDYGIGKTYWTEDRLAAVLDIPGTALAPVLACLERASLIVATEKGQFIPGGDLQDIQLITVLEAVRTLQTGRLEICVHGSAPALAVLEEVRAAMRDKLGSRSLKDLIAAAQPT